VADKRDKRNLNDKKRGKRKTPELEIVVVPLDPLTPDEVTAFERHLAKILADAFVESGGKIE
jgi:hypothetical protein